jgi:hypothetical protein
MFMAFLYHYLLFFEVSYTNEKSITSISRQQTLDSSCNMRECGVRKRNRTVETVATKPKIFGSFLTEKYRDVAL